MPRKLKNAILIGFGVGAVGVVLSLIPFILSLEEDAELSWYFARRGEVEAPSDVLVIGIDERTATALNVSEDIDNWPRSIHAELVGKLANAGASAIVFDINFAKARSSEADQAFADAIERAGNVVLLEYIEIDGQLSDEATEGTPHVLRERRFPPISLLTDRAIATAPFPLPVVPMKVSRFWLFSPTSDDSPTLPVVALQIHALSHYSNFSALLKTVRPDTASHLPAHAEELSRNNSLSVVVHEIREVFRDDNEIASEMRATLDQRDVLPADSRSGSGLLALIAMYQETDSPYLNFYGPPRTITTVPYHDAIQMPSDRLAALGVQGRVVFVGYSARTLAGQRDAYYSVFSQDSGLNLSGTEIAATGFANLLQMNTVKPLGRLPRLVLIFLWGIGLTVALCFVPTYPGIALAMFTGISYLAIASHQFASANTWWPLIVPVLIMMPLSLYSANRLQFTEERTEKERILDSAVARLDRKIVQQLRTNVANLKPDTEYMGTCLATDIQGFTNLVSGVERDGRLSEMSELMHEYWTILVRAVAENGGFVRDFIGDSMVALWLEPQQRSDACKAALTMRDEIASFNDSTKHRSFPTRVGLHFGRLRIGSIGTAGFGTELLGEPANIASRIENANKDLGTEILVSAPMLEGLEGVFVTRPLGDFVVAGKDESIQMHELIDTEPRPAERVHHLSREGFTDALVQFQNENWVQASVLFGELHKKFATDGPVRTYLRLSKRYAEKGPDGNWTGSALRLPLDLSA